MFGKPLMVVAIATLLLVMLVITITAVHGRWLTPCEDCWKHLERDANTPVDLDTPTMRAGAT